MRTIGRNAAYLIIAYGWRLVGGLIATRLVSGYMGAEAYGSYVLALSYVALFRPITTFGFSKILIRETAMAEDRDRLVQLSSAGIVLHGIATVIAVSLALVIALLGIVDHRPAFLAVALGNLALLAADNVLNVLLQGKQVMRYQGLASILATTVNIVLAVILVTLRAPLALVASILVFSVLPGFWLKIRPARRLNLLPARLDLDWGVVKRVLVEGIPVGIVILLGTALVRIDITILSRMVPRADVGIYGAAYKVLDLFIFLPTILSTVSFPALSNAWKSNDSSTISTDFRTSHNTLFVYSLFIALPICIGASIAANTVIKLVYEPEFYDAAPVLRILAIALLLQFFTPLFMNLIVSAGHQKSLIAVRAVGLATNIICNLLLIPRMGIMGSAVATVITNLVLIVGDLWLIRRHLGFMAIPFKESAPLVVAGGIMAVTGFGLGQVMNTMAAGFFGGVVYLLFVMVTKRSWIRDFRLLLAPSRSA